MTNQLEVLTCIVAFLFPILALNRHVKANLAKKCFPFIDPFDILIFMNRSAVMIAIAIVIAATPGNELCAEDQKITALVKGGEGESLVEIEIDIIEKPPEAEYQPRLLAESHMQSDLPVPRNWQKNTDTTGAKSYLVPLTETEETVAYQTLIDYLKKLTPATAKSKLDLITLFAE